MTTPKSSGWTKLMNKKTSLQVQTDTQRCREVFRSVCEDRGCELTYAELEALQSGGFIVNLKRERGRSGLWSFEWTDKLHEYAIASPGNQKRIVSDALKT